MSEDQIFAVGITIAGLILAIAGMGLAVLKAHERVTRLENQLFELAEDTSLSHFNGREVARIPAGAAIRKLMAHLGVRIEAAPARVEFVSDDEAPWWEIRPGKEVPR